MHLFFRHLGEGHPIIILHGLFGSSDNWMSIAKSMSDRYSIYIPDQRNHGLSFHSDEWDYPTIVSDLDDFIEYHNLNDPIIIGHSMGGKVAMSYATEHPNVVSKLVIVDVAPRYYPIRHGRILEGLNAIPVQELKSRGEADKILSDYVSEIGVRQFLLKNLMRNDSGTFDWKINLRVIAEKIDGVGNEVPHGQYIGPSLFIEGKDSDYITQDDEEHILELFPYAEIQSIEGAGHWVHAEKPKEFIQLVQRFLTS